MLLVEDNPYDAKLILHALEATVPAERVTVVEDGEAALEALLGRGPFGRGAIRPRVVLLDLKLPLLDGFEVLQHVRANEPACRTPIIVLTSSREENDIARAYDLGANSYVVKPVDFEALHASIRTLATYWLEVNQPPAR